MVKDKESAISRYRAMVERPMGTIAASGEMICDRSAVAAVSRLLEEPNPRIQSRAAWALGSAAAKKVDIWAARKQLERCLGERDRDVAIASAYALAIHYLNRGSKIERLISHESEAVRLGANLAISDTKREF
jgi:hypothetical protein